MWNLNQDPQIPKGPKSQQRNTALVSNFLKVFKKKHINMQMQKFNQIQRNPNSKYNHSDKQT